MLTKKQKREIDRKVNNYQAGMLKTSKAEPSLIRAWAQRFRITLELELQKQCKR